MNSTIGNLLPLALAVAISPLPVVAAILMLLAAQARTASAGFLVGWLAGIAVATIVVAVIAAATGLDSSRSPSTADSWLKVGLGVLLVALAGWEWVDRPKGEQAARAPKWMSTVDRMTAPRATGLAFVLAAINPKNLLLCIAAGVALGGAGLSFGAATVCFLVFLIIAGCTVALPVLAYWFAADRMRQPLDALKHWLQRNNTAVTAVLLLLIGVDLVGKGIAAL